MLHATTQKNLAEHRVTVFLCANSARAGQSPSSGERPAPKVPDFGWTCAVEEVILPCAGRLQPEHVLKAFEAGADAVCVVTCELDNCHTLQGNRRCERRLEYVRSLLQQLGLGAGRLLSFRLPGSAREDLALGMEGPLGRGRPPKPIAQELRSIRERVLHQVESLAPNPLRASPGPCV